MKAELENPKFQTSLIKKQRAQLAPQQIITLKKIFFSDFFEIALTSVIPTSFFAAFCFVLFCFVLFFSYSQNEAILCNMFPLIKPGFTRQMNPLN